MEITKKQLIDLFSNDKKIQQYIKTNFKKEKYVFENKKQLEEYVINNYVNNYHYLMREQTLRLYDYCACLTI